MKVLELFGGIGACTQALKRLGIDVEIDKYAVASYNAINGTNFEPQDITKWDKDIEVDLIMHGSPCQDISVAGQQAGADEGSGTRSSLMYETIRIVKKLKPKYVVWENVKNIISKKHKHNFDKYLEALKLGGYKNYWQILNSKDYGIPQNRERVFVVSIRNDIEKTFKFPKSQELKIKLKDLLDENVDKKYYLNEKGIVYALDLNDVQVGTKWEGSTLNGSINKQIAMTIGCRSASCQRAGITNYVVDNYEKEITVKEAKLLIKNNTKKGYLEAKEGDGIYTNTSNKRGTVQKQMIPTLTGFQDKGVIVVGNYMPSNHEASRIVDNEGLAPTVKENHGTVTATNQGLRIRKLTPKECWRLMGFSDEAFEKASQVNSNTQLYKQAGNSIVVNVLEAIFKELLEE